jgi:hypothetical protein
MFSDGVMRSIAIFSRWSFFKKGKSIWNSQQLQLTSVLVKQSGQSGWKTKLSPAASLAPTATEMNLQNSDSQFQKLNTVRVEIEGVSYEVDQALISQ